MPQGAEFCTSCGAPMRTTIPSGPPLLIAKRSHAGRKIVVLAALLLVVVLAFASYKPSPVPTNTATMMPVETVSQPSTNPVQPRYEIVITYTEKYSNERIGRIEPKQGFTFLVMTLQVQSNMYGGYPIDPTYFHVNVNNVKYDLDSATYSLPDGLLSLELQAGGTISGKIVFQVPVGTVYYKPTYEPPFRPVNINWIHK